jgi:hypothetical protein
MRTILPTTKRVLGIICLAGLTLQVHGFDAGPSLWLDRYTAETNGSIVWDTGHLLSNGRFVVSTSEVLDSTEIDPNADYQAISGKPVCDVISYQGYEAARIIPHWTHSKYGFPIGFETYVIVSVVGGQDPNPTITIQEQPDNQSILKGQPVLFSVSATPSRYLSYQWLFNNKPLPGKIGSLLYLTEVTAAQAGNYSVEMNTGGKNIVSAKALLRVVLPVVITSQPRSQTIKVGHGAVFRVAAQGTSPFTYQWYFNGNPIPKANGSFYSISKVQQEDAGTYLAVVGNGLSFAISSNAMLTVN